MRRAGGRGRRCDAHPAVRPTTRHRFDHLRLATSRSCPEPVPAICGRLWWPGLAIWPAPDGSDRWTTECVSLRSGRVRMARLDTRADGGDVSEDPRQRVTDGFRTAEHPRPTHFLLHLSDTHLVEGPGPLYGAVDSEARLRQIFAEVAASGIRPDAMVFTGDLADRGEPGVVSHAAVDRRAGCRQPGHSGHLGDGQSRQEGGLPRVPARGAPVVRAAGPVLRRRRSSGDRPGHHRPRPASRRVGPGAIGVAGRRTRVPARHGTILAMHHPPVPSVLDLAVLVELRDQPALAAVLRGSDVRAILAGHLHYSTTATFAGIPVSVASATCYTQDLTVPAGALRGRDGAQAFNLVHVYPDTIVHSVVTLDDGPTVGEYVSAEETAARLAAAGVRIPSVTETGRRLSWFPTARRSGSSPRGTRSPRRPAFRIDLRDAAIVEAEQVRGSVSEQRLHVLQPGQRRGVDVGRPGGGLHDGSTSHQRVVVVERVGHRDVRPGPEGAGRGGCELLGEFALQSRPSRFGAAGPPRARGGGW